MAIQNPTSTVRLKVEGCRMKNGGYSIVCPSLFHLFFLCFNGGITLGETKCVHHFVTYVFTGVCTHLQKGYLILEGLVSFLDLITFLAEA